MQLIPLENKYLGDYDHYYEYSISDLPLDLPDSYRSLLATCNGGYTYDDFFHFFGLIGPVQHNVIEWNQNKYWKDYYHLDDNCFVFAEDVFGGQYFFKRGGRKNAIYMLAPDDGKTYFIADYFENFLKDIIADSDNMYSEEKTLAEAFFAIPGNRKKYFHHLSCKTPIILGGDEEDIENLDLCESLVNLSILGQLVHGLENVKPGTIIKDVEIDYINKKVRLIF
ncbi:MAG: SMI1/KNR4 family protein [Sedimentisphaerales bacterium]|nr:SMI1/KNR4 family protein [Sedimentisphaerales bacterium]